MTLRRPARTVALVLAAAGCAHAVAPFRVSIPLGADAEGVDAPCRPAVLAAWHRGDDRELALWAVTRSEDGTTTHDHEVRSGQEPWCADAARRRLARSAALLVAAMVILNAPYLRQRTGQPSVGS